MIDILGRVLPWLFMGLGSWLAYQIVRQNGRILLRLEALEQRFGQLRAAPPAGVAIGSAAPDFELPDLEGGRKALAQFRGRRVLLIFFNPQCGYCMKMAPDLAALAVDGGDGRPMPLVVTTGDVEVNRRLIEKHGLRCPVLHQEKMEVASSFQASGTPTGYLIDEQGAIASALSVGADALLALAVAPPGAVAVPAGQKVKGTGQGCGCGKTRNGKANKGVAASRLNRSGLKAGTPAPAFRLPRLDGGELSLEDYRGRRLLLVFSDPDCGPCERLAPELERLHRHRPDLAVLIVSRRDPEANRQKVAALGLTLAVVLQKSWEISLLYGIFATPVGYLIDEQGVIAADVAQGVEPILALVSGSGAAVSSNGKAEATRNGHEVAALRS